MSEKVKNQISIRLTPTIKEMYENVSANFPECGTDVQRIEKMCELAADGGKLSTELKQELEKISAILENKEKENEALRLNLQQLQAETQTDNSETLANLQAEIEQLKAELEQANANANENARIAQQLQMQAENSGKLSQNQVIVTFGDVANELMRVTCKRLTDKLKQNVTPDKLLIDLFVKYTKQRPSDFAFPFVISKDEFNVIVSRYKD